MVKSIKDSIVKTWVEIKARYCCKSCGHTYYRNNRGWFSVNPLHVEEYNDARQKLNSDLSKKIRKCPKCSCDVKPQRL